MLQVGGVKAELQERLRQHLTHLPSEDALSSPPPASTKLDLAHAKEEEEEEDDDEEGAFAAATQMSQETDDGMQVSQVSQESEHETRVGRDLQTTTTTPTVPWDADGGRVPKALQVPSAGSRFMVSLSVAVSVMLSVAVSVISIRLYPHVGGKHGSMVLDAFQCLYMWRAHAVRMRACS